MKFYGTYKNYEGIDVCEFDTREELNSWLNGEDPSAQAFGSVLTRKELKNKALIKRMLTNKHVIRIVDIDGINWLLYRPANEIA